ncbi:hotdog fold thioesterase [Altererythrobacter sp.]|nr:hotdog fold thioesterase [Altererythrobacter sp.]
MSENIIWWGGKLPKLADFNAHAEGHMQGYIGIEFVEVGAQSLTARMPVDERTRQPYGRLHGGASVALAETVGSVAASSVVDREKFATVGMEINANHIRPAYEDYVYATATPVNIGRTTHIWSIRIVNEEGKLICISRLTMAVIALDRK